MKKPIFLLFSLLLNFNVFSQTVSMLPELKNIHSHADCKINVEQCKENIKLSLDNPNTTFPTYISHGSGSIDKVIIVIHGTGRNANEYLRDFVSNIGDDNLLTNTLVIAPHFQQVNDSFEVNELRWDKGSEHSWKYGYPSSLPFQISSYEVIDRLITDIDKTWHPKKIIIMGHSAGAQFVQRYANGSLVADQISSALTFIVSNPSSYLYSRDVRLINNNWTRPDSCPDYNSYIYGLNNLNSYFKNLTNDQIEKNYLHNHVVYLMGEADVLPEDLDVSCEANAEGPNRITRARNYFDFLNHYFPNHHHQFITVPNVGHDHIKMFDSKEFLNLLVDQDLSIERVGLENIDQKSPQRLYFLMGGGANVDQAFVDYLKALDGGDLLILSGKDQALDYNSYFMELANKNSIKLNSVTTVLVHTKNGAQDQRLLKLIKESEGIFFSGGDQWKYIARIKDTLAHAEILKKLESGIPFGGTSAGLAILGDVIFSAEKGPVGSSDISNNPLSDKITFSSSMFGIPLLKNILTDTHFVVRDRMGRLISFLANAYQANMKSLNGLAVDENTVLMIKGDGTSRVMGGGTVYLVRPKSIPDISANHLSWKSIEVFRWQNGNSFSLQNLIKPDYFFRVEDGKIISTQKEGLIY